MITVFVTLCVLMLISVAESVRRVNLWYWRRHNRTLGTTTKHWHIGYETIALNIGKWGFGFRYGLFSFLHLNPIMWWKTWYKYKQLPLLFRLQSFCTPYRGWSGASWRILFGPFDFIIRK